MNIGVIFAGGVGKRMGNTEVPKQFLKVEGKPIIIYTLEVFQKCENIDAIIVSILPESKEYMKQLVVRYNLSKVKQVVNGGATGQESIYNGLKAAFELAPKESMKDSIVLIHDGVRPNITADHLEKNIADVKKFGSSITSSKATETFLVTENINSVETTVTRDNSFIAKAPQCFFLESILKVHEEAILKGINNSIDSCTLMTDFGHSVSLTIGSNDNFKITTYSDFEMFKGIVKGDKNE